MSWLLNIFGGKLSLYAVVFLLISTGILTFTTYKLIQKNGKQKQEIVGLSQDIVDIKNVVIIKEAATAQSRTNEEAAIKEKQILEANHILASRRLLNIIELLKKEILTKDEELQKDINCLDRHIPAAIRDELFGVR